MIERILYTAEASSEGGREGHARVYWDEEDFRILGFLTAKNSDSARRLRELREFLESPDQGRRERLAGYFV